MTARLSPIASPPLDPLASHRARHDDGRDVLVLCRLGRFVLIGDQGHFRWDDSWRVVPSPAEEERRRAGHPRLGQDAPLSLAVDPS